MAWEKGLQSFGKGWQTLENVCKALEKAGKLWKRFAKLWKRLARDLDKAGGLGNDPCKPCSKKDLAALLHATFLCFAFLWFCPVFLMFS